jgi:hypothetical protein
VDLTAQKEIQMKTKWLGEALAVVGFLAAVPTAVAGNPESGCDVVMLNGNGTRLESGVIVGSSTLTIVANRSRSRSLPYRLALRTSRMERLLLSHRMSSRA